MDPATDPSVPLSVLAEAEERERQIEAKVERGLAQFVRVIREIWMSLRFLLFVVYVVFALLSFWLTVLLAALFAVRFLLRGFLRLLLWASGAVPRDPWKPRRTAIQAISEECRTRWAQRQLAYEAAARPVARHILVTRRAATTFWHWSLPHKVFALIATFFFVIVPGTYVVPRPHYVQLIDDNAIEYGEDGNPTRYLIHAVDLFDLDKTREYENERAWWFGKINPQGLKNTLQTGRFYKFWVVGLRWYYLPTLYPNIITATETDAQGQPLEHPSHFLPPATTGR